MLGDTTSAPGSRLSFGKGTRCRIDPSPGSSTSSSLVLPLTSNKRPSGDKAMACGRSPGRSMNFPAGVMRWFTGRTACDPVRPTRSVLGFDPRGPWMSAHPVTHPPTATTTAAASPIDRGFLQSDCMTRMLRPTPARAANQIRPHARVFSMTPRGELPMNPGITQEPRRRCPQAGNGHRGVPQARDDERTARRLHGPDERPEGCA